MEIGEYRYQKSELIQVAEQIYEYTSKKQQLELELSSEEFHEKYIPKREKMVKSRLIANMPLLLGLLSLNFIGIAIWVYFLMIYRAESSGGISGAYGMALLGSGLIIIYSIRLMFSLIAEESEMAVRFIHSKNPEKAMRFAKKHDINTFQDDRVRTESKIADLKERILVYDNKIHNLEIRQQEIIDEKEKQEDILRKHDIIKDVDKENDKESSFGLSLKEEDFNSADIQELNEYYNKEQDYILFGMKDLNFKLAAADKEIANIGVEMEMVKKRIFIFVIAFMLAAFIQAFIPGFIGGIYGVVCFVVSLISVFGIERACRGPIIRYLVENESPFVAEYCFKNNVVPVKQKRKEINMLIEQQLAALEDVKNKKKALDERLDSANTVKYEN